MLGPTTCFLDIKQGRVTRERAGFLCEQEEELFVPRHAVLDVIRIFDLSVHFRDSDWRKSSVRSN